MTARSPRTASNLSFLGKLVVSLLATLLYTAVFLFFFPIVRGGIATLVILPVALIAWFTGRYGGLAAGFLLSGLTGLLFTIIGETIGSQTIMMTAISNTTAMVIVGGLVGYLSEMISKFRAQNIEMEGQEAERRQMEEELVEAQTRLVSSVEEILATSRQQEHGATEQSSSAEETRAALALVHESNQQIAGASQRVANNAVRALEANRQVDERIRILAVQTERISEFLSTIREIADKSDLLALNAALEGARAGEHGRGFTLVATQMQQLAENVVDSVNDIKKLVEDISEATSSSIAATGRSTELTKEATESVQEINDAVRQQVERTENIATAIDDIATVAGQTARGSAQVLKATEDLMHLSQAFQGLTKALKLGAHERL